MLRLRPIMMTALVAAFGLLPAALSTGCRIGLVRPGLAIVIVAAALCADQHLLMLCSRGCREGGDRLEVRNVNCATHIFTAEAQRTAKPG